MFAAMDSSADGLHGAARARAMTAVGLAVLISALDYAVANVALPTIARDIHTSEASSIWVVNAYQLASLIALLPVASLGEIVGFARLCRIGLAVFVAASALCALSRTLPELAAARTLQGLGGACIMGVNAALVRFIYPAAMLGRGIALNGLILAVGIALGPSLASAVLAVTSWPWLFWINLPLGLAALALAVSSLPATPRARRPFDLVSATLLALGLGPLIIGLDSFAHRAPPARAAAFAAVGAVGLALLMRRESGRPNALFPVDLLRARGFRVAFEVGFLAFIASNFFIIAMPFLIEGRLGRDAVATGLLMTPWAIAVAAGSALIGRIADKAPASILSAAGLSITAIGFLLLRFMPAHPSDAGIALRIALAGFGFGLFQPPNNRAMLLEAPSARSGGASGLVSAARLFGQTIGAMLVAIAFGRIWGSEAAPRECLGCGAAVAAFAAAISLSRRFRAG